MQLYVHKTGLVVQSSSNLAQFAKTPTVWPLDHLPSLYLPPTALWGCVEQDGDETG